LAINIQIKLDNGLEMNYFIISKYSIDINNKKINVTLAGFISEEYYNRALIKENLKSKLDSFNIDIENEDSVKEYNSLLEQYNSTRDFKDYIVGYKEVKVPLLDDFSINTLEKEILDYI